MDKEGAIQAMKDGLKVTHPYFSEGEYIYMKRGKLYDHNNTELTSYYWDLRKGRAWQDNWTIVDEPTPF